MPNLLGIKINYTFLNSVFFQRTQDIHSSSTIYLIVTITLLSTKTRVTQ